MNKRSTLIAWAVAACLSACGGGGSTDSTTPAGSNTAPVANAGPTQSVMTGTTVTLNASASTDANGDALTYQWTLDSKPAGSAAQLSSTTAVMPTLNADLAGSYVFSLTVNDGKTSSAVSNITLTAAVANAAPVANAGLAQNVTTGSLVTLDGSASSDVNGDGLTYSWTLSTKPAGSVAVLSSGTGVRPTFLADVAGTYEANLTVNDGQLNSAANTVTVTAASVNVVPVANAGGAQNVKAGSLVMLDGSASTDANGDLLTYAWTLTSKPVGSTGSVLLSAISARPSFIADVAGTYVATLTVNDGKVNSSASTVTVTASAVNVAPVANAGSAQNVTIGSLVTLDGSMSSDANGDSLTYAWVLSSKPSGSTAVLSLTTSVSPKFTADATGTYVATLMVNDGKVSSGYGVVTVTAAAENVAPVANAGPAQNVRTGSLVVLNGGASSDANGDAITYAWTLTSKPVGSTAALSLVGSDKPIFVADAAGTYVVTLTVNDGRVNSSASTVTITASAVNVAPVANAGAAQNVTVGSLVTLDGSASSDANGDSLAYAWILTSKPIGSAATLFSTASVKPTFMADVVGTYVSTLTVNDGKVNSVASTVTVTTATPASGLLSSSDTWTANNSPYILVGRLMIPAGKALSVDPGVEVIGNGYQIQVEGSLLINGVAANRVSVKNVNITPAGQQSSNHLISIVGANLSGGSLYAPTGNAIYGNLVLTDSRLTNMSSYMYIWYPTGATKIERNYFSGTGGISFGLSAGSVTIKNNAFINWNGVAVENWAQYGGAVDFSLNSFLSTSLVAARLPAGYTNAILNAANNYWGTNSSSVIDGMIFDKNDDLTANGFVTYIPILTSPHPNTPQ